MNEGILGIVLTGELTNDSIEKIKNEVFDIEKSMNTKNVLIDIRKLKGRIGFTEAYSFVRNFPAGKRGRNHENVYFCLCRLLRCTHHK